MDLEEDAGGRRRIHQFLQTMVDIMIRLPPLFVMDSILLTNLGVLTEPSFIQAQTAGEGRLNISQKIENSTDLYNTFGTLYGGNPVLLLLPHFLRFLGSSSLFFASLLTFLLPSLAVLQLYSFLLCCSALPLSLLGYQMMSSQQLDSLFIQSQLFSNIGSSFGRAVALNYLHQCTLALCLKRFLVVDGDHATFVLEHLSGFLSLPCLIFLFPLSLQWLMPLAFAANIPTAALLILSFSQQVKGAVRYVRQFYVDKLDFVNNFGLNTLLETEWMRLCVPTVLRAFWLSRSLFIIFLSFPFISWREGLKTVLVRGSDTLITVLGMTSVVSSLSHWLGVLFQLMLHTEDDDEKSVASVSAVLFFVLALQTGLTGMEGERRFHQIAKNFCLLVTAILHFIHSMVQPVLMSLSASRSSNRSSHLRALTICFFLILAPSLLVSFLWLHFKIGTWLLAVTAFCIEVVIKVFVTLAIYGLFMWDAHCQDGLWESLDDWVYYIRSFGNTIEFCFAVFLFFNGGWILMFESGGTIRAIMMLIHAYFNIWCEARSGWSSFSKRRTAVAKINSLSDATPHQLRAHNDVCAICYQEMVVAKRTRCRHMFHSICLRKWLYMQDNCPMCHERLYQSEASSQTDEPMQENVARQDDHEEDEVDVRDESRPDVNIHQSENEENLEKSDQDTRSEGSSNDLDDESCLNCDSNESDEEPEYYIDDEGNYVFPLVNPVYVDHSHTCPGNR